MRILVTGADGFLGRGLVAALPNAYPDAEKIVLTDRPFSSAGSSEMDIVPGDLANRFHRPRGRNPVSTWSSTCEYSGGLAESEQALGHRQPDRSAWAGA